MWADSPLHCCASDGKVEELRKLIETHDVNDTDVYDGATPLHVALESCHFDCALVLVEGGADLSVGIVAPCEAGCFECVAAMLARGADVNAATEWGVTGLTAAARGGHVDCVRLLIDTGAALDTRTWDGMTALFVACSSKRTDCALRLIEAGADVDRATADGRTPLFAAARNGDSESVAKLIEAGACVTTPADNGETPLFAAAEHGHVDVVRRLITDGALVNHVTKYGSTALWEATTQGKTDVVQLLLRHRRDLRFDAMANPASVLYIVRMSGFLQGLPWLPYADTEHRRRTRKTLQQRARAIAANASVACLFEVEGLLMQAKKGVSGGKRPQHQLVRSTSAPTKKRKQF